MEQGLVEFARHVGISRLANLTGLDRVGYPVVAAIRPLSRNLSVSFGKGDTLEQAKISAVMEAAELCFSEVPPMVPLLATFNDLPPDTALDPSLLEPNELVADIKAHPLQWVSGFELGTNRLVHVPWQTTSMDFTVEARKQERVLQFGATGLAAAFEENRAVLHGLCEVIERDSHDRWNSLDDDQKLATLVNQNSIQHQHFSALFEKITDAQLKLLLWDMTGPADVPCYLAEILDLADGTTTAFAQGAAAGLSAHIAICKAIAEALQVRLTYIAGSRDDLDWADYGNRYEATVASRLWLIDQRLAKRQVLHPPIEDASALLQLEYINQRLKTAGGRGAVAVCLTPHQHSLSVVKVLVPLSRDLPDVEAFAPVQSAELAVSLS